MPSLTPTVLNRIPTSPASTHPRFTWFPSSARCMLHGLPSYHTLPIPTCGLFKSSHESPVAISIACEAPWLAGCVIREEYLFKAPVEFFVAVVIVNSKPSERTPAEAHQPRNIPRPTPAGQIDPRCRPNRNVPRGTLRFPRGP